MKERVFWTLLLAVCFAGFTPAIFAQTPTPTAEPLPGTPVALTCFEPGFGVGAVSQITTWDDFDSGAVVLEANDPGDYPIAIRMVEGAFLPPENYGTFNIKIWAVQNESLLPDLNAACVLKWGPHAYGYTPSAPMPDLVWLTFDLEAYVGTQDLPVFNQAGDKFVVQLEYIVLDPGNFPPLDLCAEFPGTCPGYYANETNIIYEYPNNWNWKEDVSASDTNLILQARYMANVEAVYDVPATTPIGIALILAALTIPLFRRRR